MTTTVSLTVRPGDVYGISPTLTACKRAHAIGVDLLSDFKRAVCRRYGTLLEEVRRKNGELLERIREVG